MKQKLKFGSLSVAMALTLVACGGDNSNSGHNTDNNTGGEKQSLFVAERGYTKDTMDYSSSISIIDYKMKNVQGKEVETSALVMFPQQKAPEGGYKIVVWQHGTLGVGDLCAPTNTALSTRYKDPLFTSLLKAGYVIIAPDYEGLGGEGMHPYLHIGSQAVSSINAVKSAQEHYKNLSKDWMTVGQSQGGQASLGTAEYLETNGGGENYHGAVAGAPASKLREIILDIAPPMLAEYEKLELAQNAPISYRQQSGTIAALGTLLAYNSFYTAGIKATEPKFDYSAILYNPSTYDIAKMAEGSTGDNGVCLNEGYIDENGNNIGLSQLFAKDIAKFLTDNPDKGILDYPRNDRQAFEADKVLNEALDRDELQGMKLSKPIMIIQGTADTSVPYPVTEILVGKYKDAGTDLTFVPSVGSAHSQAIVKEVGSLMTFVQKHMPSGVEPQKD